jgi:hypothetical protein
MLSVTSHPPGIIGTGLCLRTTVSPLMSLIHVICNFNLLCTGMHRPAACVSEIGPLAGESFENTAFTKLLFSALHFLSTIHLAKSYNCLADCQMTMLFRL